LALGRERLRFGDPALAVIIGEAGDLSRDPAFA
jgi:hypothetical protein